MNLVSLVKAADQTYYRGMKLSPIQQYLYNLFNKAIMDGRTLLIPSDLLPRGCGKSTVLQRLSEEHCMYVMHNSSVLSYSVHGRGRIRGYYLRGTNVRHLLIDEPTTFTNIERSGGDLCKLYGFSHELENYTQSFRSELDIAELKVFIEVLEEEGSL